MFNVRQILMSVCWENIRKNIYEKNFFLHTVVMIREKQFFFYKGFNRRYEHLKSKKGAIYNFAGNVLILSK